ELSDIGSPRADDHEHLMLPEMLEDPYLVVILQEPPFPDYIPGREEPEQAPPSPDYDPEEDPVDYLADGGDDGDDEEESSEDDEDDDMEAPSAEETEPFETDESAATPPPHPAYHIALGPRYEVGESLSVAAARPAGGLRADYRFVATKQMAPRRTTRSTTDQETINAIAVTNAQLQAMVDQGVTAALAARDALRSTNGDDSHNSKTGETRNGTLGSEGKGDQKSPVNNLCKFHHSGSCTVKCGNYKKVGHIIQNCRTPATTKNQKTRTCYEYGILRHYKGECPIVKFHEYADMIHGRMGASKPKTTQDAIEIATKLRNKKISTLVECQTKNKKRLDNTSKNNQNQQQPKKRQNISRAYTARHGEKKHYGGSKPLCSKCDYHHDGPWAPKCHKYNRFGHLARDCRSSTNVNTTNIQKGTKASQKATCYECGNQGHYMRDCPEQKN
nr:hypothetical protein [Tanacetum cinerariifolium]